MFKKVDTDRHHRRITHKNYTDCSTYTTLPIKDSECLLSVTFAHIRLMAYCHDSVLTHQRTLPSNVVSHLNQ